MCRVPQSIREAEMSAQRVKEDRKHDESMEHHGKGFVHHKPKLKFQMNLTNINALLGSMKS